MTDFSSENKQFIIDCALLCKLAYASETIMRNSWKTILGNRLMECPTYMSCPMSDAQALGCVYQQDTFKAIVFAFRGTSSLTDAVTDMNFVQVPLTSRYTQIPAFTETNALVHKGFHSQYIGLEKQMIEYITSALNKNTNIHHIAMIGHSLGSSIGAIAAAVVKSFPVHNELDVGLITFGNPRVGNKGFLDFLNKSISWSLEVKHGRDPIISIIPNIWNYMHPCTIKRQIGRVDPY
ncbi:MAG: lipase family protein, partial [Sphingobacteriaceae bacterium]